MDAYFPEKFACGLIWNLKFFVESELNKFTIRHLRKETQYSLLSVDIKNHESFYSEGAITRLIELLSESFPNELKVAVLNAIANLATNGNLICNHTYI